MKYFTIVTFIGNKAYDLLQNNMIILFNDNAPPELKSYCVLHNDSNLLEKIKIGDKLHIDNYLYTVTAVGNVANENLKNLGHIVLVFDGSLTSQLPGYIHLKPKLNNKIDVNTKIYFE